MSDQRWIAQRILTGQLLAHEVPFATAGQPTEVLSGPGIFSGTISPELAALRASDGSLLLDEWGTALFYEDDGVIRWGGIVQRSRFDEDRQAWTVDAAGYTSYASGYPYDGVYRPANGIVDPFDVVRHLWAHVQALPDSDLNLVVDTHASGRTVGDPDHDKPYELLWYANSPECGEEIDDLAKSVPFDYLERHSWAPAGDADFYDDASDPDRWQAVVGPTPTRLRDPNADNYGSDLTGHQGGWIMRGTGAPAKHWMHRHLIPFDPTKLYRISARVRNFRNSTVAGQNLIYLGFAGVGADGSTLVNTTGANSSGGQHYVLAAATAISSLDGWLTYTGYLQGTAATGTGSARPDQASPGQAHTNVRYLRPYVIGNYNGGDGIFDLDWFRVDIVGGVRGRIAHQLKLGYPRLGRRRTDLRFAVGENVTLVPTGEVNGEDWASHIRVLGVGEGREKLRAYANRPTAGRLRRWRNIDDASLRMPDTLRARAERELARTGRWIEFDSLTVDDTPAAPAGSLSVGDDICVRAELPWIGEVALWHRVLSRTLPTPGAPSVLTLARTERFA